MPTTIPEPESVMQIHRKTGRDLKSRRAVASVELAVCLPVIVLLVFGSIEASSFIFLKQSLNVAAYEGVRVATLSDSGNAEAKTIASNILDSRDVSGFQIDFPNGESRDADRGDKIVVVVSAQTTPNSPLAGQFVSNRLLRARVVMVKE